MKNNKTVEPVVRSGLCTGCGTCVGICPRDAVEMVIDYHQGIYVPLLVKERCNECGLCYDACPGHSVDFRQLNLEIFGKEPDDVLLGNYLNCYIGHATDHNIRYNSASGGLVTALLIFALEEGLIQGALVTRMREDRPLEPQPFIARTKEEIISASKSKYCPVPANVAIEEILKEEGKFAVVGLPCHIHGIRKAEMVNRKLRERIPLHLGIFCAHTDSFLLTDFILHKYAIKKADVAELYYRGQGWPGSMLIRLRDGMIKPVPFPELMAWHVPGLFCPVGCKSCSDGTAELGDISFGDAWLPELRADKVGSSIILCRNEAAEDLVRKAENNNRVRVTQTRAVKVVESQKGLLYSKKKCLKAKVRVGLVRRNANTPTNTLASDTIDYLFVIYQHLSSSFLVSNPFLLRILKYVPHSIMRLYELSLAVVPVVRMKGVIRKRYQSWHGGVRQPPI